MCFGTNLNNCYAVIKRGQTKCMYLFSTHIIVICVMYLFVLSSKFHGVILQDKHGISECPLQKTNIGLPETGNVNVLQLLITVLSNAAHIFS